MGTKWVLVKNTMVCSAMDLGFGPCDSLLVITIRLEENRKLVWFLLSLSPFIIAAQ